MTSHQIHTADCLDWMRAQPACLVDLTVTSPPYEDARTYGIGFKLKGQAWVDWCIPRVVEMCRITNGLVIFNAAGKVRDWKYSPVMEWLVADLTRLHGIVCGPAPYVFARVGIPGSGSKHYHRRDWEPVYAFALADRLPLKWSANTAMGHPPKWTPGGPMSHRNGNGNRRNQWGGNHASGGRAKSGEKMNAGHRPSHIFAAKVAAGAKIHTKHDAETEMREQAYLPPVLANPGNVIKCKVGGGLMGSPLAHENEAPFPESLVEFFMRSYCPPGGTAFDPFAGSGTVLAVAKRTGRNGIGIDVRDGQCDLIRRRLATVQPELIG
jgi:hypothetical protein